MHNTIPFFVYLLACAGVTYLVRAVPFVLFKKKITNKFINSFLYYVPYAVLAVMTIPGIFYSTGRFASAVVGFIVACILAYFEKSLLAVAANSCLAVFLTELAIKYLL